MKNFVYLFVSVLLLLNFSSCSSSKTNTSEKDFLGTWYPDKPNSENRIRISEKLFISERMSYG